MNKYIAEMKECADETARHFSRQGFYPTYGCNACHAVIHRRAKMGDEVQSWCSTWDAHSRGDDNRPAVFYGKIAHLPEGL